MHVLTQQNKWYSIIWSDKHFIFIHAIDIIILHSSINNNDIALLDFKWIQSMYSHENVSFLMSDLLVQRVKKSIKS